MSGLRLVWRVGLATAVAAGAVGTAAVASGGHARAAVICPTVGGVVLTQDATKSGTPSDGSNAFVVCNGKVPSFDGTPILIDVSIPASFSSASPQPLLMLLSGWSNDICQFESSTLSGTAVTGCTDFIGNPAFHWNNAWAASNNGWIGLTYTPRGWFESCGKVGTTYSYVTDAACKGSTKDAAGEKSWVHLYDRRYEIRDAQYLAGLLVDAGLVNPNQIITTGDSGGGGPSWDLALSQDQVALSDSTPTVLDLTPWVSPLGTALHLVAALPMYTWTDLVDSLTPNGLASDGFYGAPPDGNHQTPVGVEKETYVAGLYALGNADAPDRPSDGAQYVNPLSTPNTDPTADLNKWFADIQAGEPAFSVNPDTPTILAQIGGALRSPLTITVPPAAQRKPIFVIQGFTDPLFPTLQPLTMINHLDSACSCTYPVWGFLGDVGHSYANNPLDVWTQAHNESNAWLATVLAGQTPAQPRITADTTRCVPGQTLQTFTSSSFGSISTSQLTFTSAPAQNIASSNGPTSEGTATDPITSGGCRVIAATTDPNQASYTFNITAAATLVGGPVVSVASTITGTSAELASRLWDLDPSGNQTLITRSVLRLDEGTAPTTTTTLAFELWPNAWQLQCGHQVKLELTQNDLPTWRPDNLTSSIQLSNLRLTLPVVPGSGCSFAAALPESALAPALPLVAVAAIGGFAILRRRRRRQRAAGER
jgi:hypothetical protein